MFFPNTYPAGAVGHRSSAVTTPIDEEIFTKLEQLEPQGNSWDNGIGQIPNTSKGFPYLSCFSQVVWQGGLALPWLPEKQ